MCLMRMPPSPSPCGCGAGEAVGTPDALPGVMRNALRYGMVALLLSTAGLVTQGCYVEAEPVYAEGYQPAFYNGYLVYYDAGGRPFYYERGVPVFVPVTSPFYIGLVNHWHTYGPAYGRWYAHYGARYRGYRRR